MLPTHLRVLDKEKDAAKDEQTIRVHDRPEVAMFLVRSRRGSRWVMYCTIQIGAFDCTPNEEKHATNNQQSVRVPDRTKRTVFSNIRHGYMQR
jgi:hypothetical protein